MPTFTGSDALGSYADTVAKALRTLPRWNDQLGGSLPLSVNLSADSLGLYADQPPAVIETIKVSANAATDSLGLYADQPPAIIETISISAGTATDSLGLYADQSQVIVYGVLSTTTSDSLAGCADALTVQYTQGVSISDSLGLTDQPPTIIETIKVSANAATDSLGLYADQSQVIVPGVFSPTPDSLANYADALTIGLIGGISQSDSLGLYSDQAPTIRQNLFVTPVESLVYADVINGFFTLRTTPSDDLNQWVDIATGLQGLPLGLTADSFNSWADTFAKLYGELTGLNDSMTSADQLAGAAAILVRLSDALPVYADQILKGGQTLTQLSDGIPIWNDQIATDLRTIPGIPRQGWIDSFTVTTQGAGARTVNLSDARPSFTDSVGESFGYQHGFVIYLVDENGNYIVDENGNRFLVSGLIDNLQQGDALAVTRTTAGTTPRIVSVSDSFTAYSDTVQVSQQIVTLKISLVDDLVNFYDEFFSLIAGLVFSGIDAVGGYNDSSPSLTTSGEKRVDQSDALPTYVDALQVQLTSFIDRFISLADDLGGYADTILINTSGGLLTAAGDTLANYNDTSAIERTGALVAVLIGDALVLADQITINVGILRSASDNLAAYADGPAQLRGLLYSTPADGAANYLDLVTFGGSGQLQAALSDNLGQYNDGPPATFANCKAQPPADALIFADSTQRVLAGGYALSDSALAIDDLLDLRLGLFNELRYGLSDNMNQWADAAAYSRVFLAIKLSGKVIEQVALSGKLITERISLTGEFYTGDP